MLVQMPSWQESEYCFCSSSNAIPVGLSRMFRATLRKSRLPTSFGRRTYKVLAIESSCDDSCIALLEKSPSSRIPEIVDHVKTTLNSSQTGGIIPTDAHSHHQASLSTTLQDFLTRNQNIKPDLICCTRGPGMVGSLSAGLQLAKGLAIAWSVPLIGVHHMLGHILVSILSKPNPPKYPFLSLLCSGGHSILVLLKSINDHRIIINTMDIAAGDSLDKCARELGFKGNMLGKELEAYIDSIPSTDKELFQATNTSDRSLNDFGLKMTLPLKKAKHHQHRDKKDDENPTTILSSKEPIKFAFSGFLSSVRGYKEHSGKELNEYTKQFLAYKIQEMLFDHILDRINLALDRHSAAGDHLFKGVNDFIFSGGVAANKRLRAKLSEDLKYKGNFHFPSLELCTDNAIMIGIAGIEMFEELRLKSDLSVLPIRKWPLDELRQMDNSGGWINVTEDEYERVTRNT